MIPKKIHYCWFGKGEFSPSMRACIDSWKKYCPDYEIIEWNEENFDVGSIPFTKTAYDAGKWAFVSDYARLKIIYEHGGIYLDTDVELLKSLDSLLHLGAFAGFEGDTMIATGLGFGAEAGHPFVKAIMEDYHNREFPSDGNGCEETACPVINTGVLYSHGFVADGSMQTVLGATLFPKEYFNPKDSQTYRLTVTENTYSIHHYDASWKKGNSMRKQRLIKAFVRMFGEKNLFRLKKMLKKFKG